MQRRIRRSPRYRAPASAALAGLVLARGELRVPAHATADLSGQVVTGHDTHGKHLLTRLSGPADELTVPTHLRIPGS